MLSRPHAPTVGQHQPIRTWVEVLKDEVFNVMPDTVIMRRHTDSWVSQMSNILQNAPHTGVFKGIFEEKKGNYS